MCVFGMSTAEVILCHLGTLYRGGSWFCVLLLLLFTLSLDYDGFVHCKVTIFLFIINTNLGEDSLRLCKHPVSP